MLPILSTYKNAFKGLSIQVWYLAIIGLVNRAGAMVIPFLSIYLREDLHLSLDQVGWVMVSFGIGAVLGSRLGGRLSDKIGFYHVMWVSLLGAGIIFILLQYAVEFWQICTGFFLLTLVSDMYRPAVFMAVSAYSKPANLTRSIGLIRLAFNLGFSMGPAIGGLIITYMSYGGLFWVDGLTCLVASLLFVILLSPKRGDNKKAAEEQVLAQGTQPAYKDKLYLIFLGALFLVNFIFLQYFSNMPLFYKGVIGMTEGQIGWIMSLNGALIFIFEMPLIQSIDKPGFSKMRWIIFSVLLIGMSFLAVVFSPIIILAVVGMIMVSLGEMICFPFSNAWAIQRSKRGRRGDYISLYTMTFSFAHIFGHKLGLYSIEHFGFEQTWYLMFGISLLAMGLFYVVRKRMNKRVTLLA